MRNQKGITLVALVVTIVVLLILAGTSIAMLKGDNGIITNAQKATASNTEGQVVENIKNAYNTVKTMVIVGASTDPAYDAQDSATEAKIANTIASEILGTSTTLTSGDAATGNGYSILYTATSGSTAGTVVITYTDSTFKTGVTFAGTTMGPIEAKITIEKANTTLDWQSPDVDATSSPASPYLIPNY